MRTLLPCGLLLVHTTLIAQATLTVSGRATLPSEMHDAIEIAVLTACGDTIAQERTFTGEFRFLLHRRSAYTICFFGAGLATRELVVDAAQLPDLPAQDALRSVRFDVLMNEGDDAAAVRFSHPVGFINYRPNAGSLELVYDDADEAASGVHP